MENLFIIIGTVTDEEVAAIYSELEQRPVRVGDQEFRVTNDPVNPGSSADYASLKTALENHPGAQVVGVAGEVVTNLFPFVTYTTYTNEDPVALTPADWHAVDVDERDIDEWVWHLAPSKEAAIEKHYTAFDEYVGHGQDHYVHCDGAWAKVYEEHKALLVIA